MCGDRQYSDEEIRETMDALGTSGWHSRLVSDRETNRLHNPDDDRGERFFFDNRDDRGGPYLVSSAAYDIVARYDADHGTDFVRSLQAPATSPDLRESGFRSGSMESDQHDNSEACRWDTDGDGNCAFHSDCASRTFRHIKRGLV